MAPCSPQTFANPRRGRRRASGARAAAVACALAVVAAGSLGGCADGVIGESAARAPDGGAGAPDGAPEDPATPDGGSVGTSNPDAAAEPALPCDQGDVQLVHDDRCYMLFSSVVATWQAARNLCELLGGGAHLATIADADEDAVIMQLGDLAGPGDLWVGGNDLDLEGTWVWITGEPMTYTNWGLDEPNDYGDGEDCMIMRKLGTGADPGYNVDTWDDRPCDRTYAFVCERP